MACVKPAFYNFQQPHQKSSFFGMQKNSIISRATNNVNQIKASNQSDDNHVRVTIDVKLKNSAQIEDIDSEVNNHSEKTHKVDESSWQEDLKEAETNHKDEKHATIVDRDQNTEVKFLESQPNIDYSSTSSQQQLHLIYQQQNLLHNKLQKIEELLVQQNQNRRQFLRVKGVGNSVVVRSSVKSIDAYRLTSISFTKTGYLAIFDDGQYFLNGYEISKGLIEAIENASNDINLKPILVSIGPGDYYFILFSDFTSKFNAPSTFEQFIEQYENDELFLSVAFTEDGYVVVHERDGVMWSKGSQTIPESLEEVLDSSYPRNVRFVSIGCEGSWFVGYKDGSNKCFLKNQKRRLVSGYEDNGLLYYSDAQYGTLCQYRDANYGGGSYEIQQVIFGQDDNFFVYRGFFEEEEIKFFKKYGF